MRNQCIAALQNTQRMRKRIVLKKIKSCRVLESPDTKFMKDFFEDGRRTTVDVEDDVNIQ